MLTTKDIDAAVEKALKDLKDASRAGPVIAAVVAREVVKALGDLEKRLGQLERDALVFAGAWDPTKTFAANDLTQRGGSLWLALVDVKAGNVPGASSSWRRIAQSKE